MANSNSIEGSAAVLGAATSRDGGIQRRGCLLGRIFSTIRRVCKSPFASEAHAALAAADQAMWPQVLLLTEIATWMRDIAKIAHPATFHLPDPCGPSPTDGEVASQRNASSQSRPSTLDTCHRCQPSMPTAPLVLMASGHSSRTVSSTSFAPLRPLLLTDSGSLFSAILRLQPTSQDKRDKRVMNQLRDLHSLIAVAFVDSTRDLGYIETKHDGSLTILTRLPSKGIFSTPLLERNAQMMLQRNPVSPQSRDVPQSSSSAPCRGLKKRATNPRNLSLRTDFERLVNKKFTMILARFLSPILCVSVSFFVR